MAALNLSVLKGPSALMYQLQEVVLSVPLAHQDILETHRSVMVSNYLLTSFRLIESIRYFSIFSSIS